MEKELKYLENYLAKDTGETIIEHTNKVLENIEHLIEKNNLEQNECEILKIAAKLHDIGKLTQKNQLILKNKKCKINFRHNIIGWYFIIKYLKNDYQREKISNLVLWHHANYDSCENLFLEILNIEKEITNEDLKTMKDFCSFYGIELSEEENEDFSKMDTKFYSESKKNYYFNLLRSILITSDVYASSHKEIEDLFAKSYVFDNSELEKNIILSSERTKKQLDITDQINNSGTTLIKAPTGFGKTMIGILWSLRNKNKMIWVCPTNVISHSIYDDIIRDLDKIGQKINVELYLTGERVKHNGNLTQDFESDIIVTNIDNFLKPSISNSYGARSLMIYNSNVLFDEVHDYDNMQCALFEAFNGIMDIRHNKIKSSTLFLTATPTTFRFINVGGDKIKYLPNENEHYEAIHNQKYNINFIEKRKDLEPDILNGEFVFFNNTVDDVQKEYLEYNNGKKIISHGKFLDEDKENKKNSVLSNYGKNGNREEIAVFTNQILTTSCDYSVRKMFIKSPTIISFFQSIGRLNRWGDMGKSVIYLIMEKTPSDKKFIGDDIENGLQDLFVKELKENFENKDFILNELYVFYNNFLIKNKKLFKLISEKNQKISIESLENVYPKPTNKNGENIKVSNGNKLRKSTSSDEIFILVNHLKTKENVTININIPKVIEAKDLFEEDEKNTWKKQLKIIKKYKNYNKHKKIDRKYVFKNSIFYDSPYPVFNFFYDDEIGLVKEKILNPKTCQ